MNNEGERMVRESEQCGRACRMLTTACTLTNVQHLVDSGMANSWETG